ncbi:MAG: teichoic acid ABC transporter ATP-binding protein [Candidatus Marinimicrobia bacterium]|nr:teichoic acid ABC transporter ATP-binding protein [Candidatus Neomarinimicrobiota bacterium]|tara:strand:+ start:1133 stop:1867 length:735 start_codon:yes stop_codon:yes gene_type:complete
MTPVLELNNITLDYPKGQSVLSIIKRKILQLLRKKTIAPHYRGLDGINLTINRGEIIGVIGRNGSSKSTLLKVMAGIFTPDEGTVLIDGDISLLSGVGQGMNKHLTGRENIHLYGSILGHSKETMDSLTDQIIEFSELHDFIDEPLRTYSSGMRARLGISVATAVKPDLLLIDEVLGVGDPGFKKKSQEKIRKMMDDSNTVIIVSHSFGLLKEICDRMIMMEKGRIKILGTPEEVISKYNEIEG